MALDGHLCSTALWCTDITLAWTKCCSVQCTDLRRMFSAPLFSNLEEKKKNLIFENEDFLSDSSDNVNPLQLKLNLAAVVLFVPNHEWTSEHMLKVPVWAQHYTVQLQAGIFLFYLFLTKKRHWLHATTGIFQVLGTAETLRNKSYNFNRGGARLQTDFQYKRSDSRDHSLQFSASSALKRC